MDDKNIEKSPPEDASPESLPTSDPVTQPAYAHLYNLHPKPEVAVTIRKLLLKPALELLSTMIVYRFSKAELERYQCTKFFIVAGVASVVVNVPLYVRLRRASANPEYYYVGFGPSPRSSPATEWNPRRITHSAKLRWIIPLVVVAALWLLTVGVFAYFDFPYLFSELRALGARSVTLPVWRKILYYFVAGLGYWLLFMSPFIIAIPFIAQARICYNCALERQWFFALDITRGIIAILDEERAQKDSDSDITLVQIETM